MWKFVEVWKIVLHSILEIFITLHSGIFHILYRNFRSIPFHSIPFPGCRFCAIIIVVTFYPNDCSQFENLEAPDFEKIASASTFLFAKKPF